jgi:hypothetical protein
MKTELFERLKSKAYQSPDWESIDQDTIIERMVELAVRECANVCRDDGRWFQEQDDKVEAGVAYALCYKIKQHFGVEE